MPRLVLLAALAATACGAATPRFPADVHAALAAEPMRRLETASLVVYYPARRADLVRRFATHAEGCATALRARAQLRNGFWHQKLVLVMPEMPFNNAYVQPAGLGFEPISVIPTFNTFDFATEFGLPPDPSHIACHELVHYVQFQQTAGLWGGLDRIFGNLISPQIGLDSWLFEGLATHYESALQPGAGRPRWPAFRGVFHAGYAGEDIDGGDLSELGRRAPGGHNYLVGTYFVDFLIERYGEQRLWHLIALQGRSPWLMFNVNGRFRTAYGRSLSALIDEFAAWARERFPVRPTPPSQRRIRTLGMDARYARGPGGHEAAVWNDVDAPAHLTVWGPDGRELTSLRLVDVVPPRQLITASPFLTSGLGVTADGRVFVTALDVGATFQRTRLLRWDGDLDEIATDLGPGAAVDPAGRTYYYLAVDGDRWSLGAYDLMRNQRRVITPTQPGQYVLAAQVSPDGRRVIASVWDGAFVLWILDASTGARLSEIRTSDRSPVYGGAFADDATVTYLASIDGRFQVVARDVASGATRSLTDAPYAVIDARPVGDRVRFLNRQGWRWTVDEVAFARPDAAAPAPVPAPVATPPSAAPPVATILSDRPYSLFDGLFSPQLHSIAAVTPGPQASLLGLALAGGDRLGFQRWALAGFLSEQGHLSGSAGYVNAMLAPWMFQVAAQHLEWIETRVTDDDIDDNDRRFHRWERVGLLTFGRTWRETISLAALGVVQQDRIREVVEDADGDDVELDAPARRMSGAGLSASVFALDTTRVSTARRGWWMTLDGLYYPRKLTSFEEDIGDLRGALVLTAPLPFTRRHGLALELRGRGIVSDGDHDLIELGGSSVLPAVWDDSNQPEPPDFDDDPRLPDAVRFREPLRGYEDFSIATDAVAIAELSWTYPLIIDRGFATTLWLLPSSFVRQIDLELFATGALDERGRDAWHGAAGAAATLRFAFWRVPLALGYQAARRLADDDAITQIVLFGAAL